MEIAIAVFLGLWFFIAGLVAYMIVKHDFKEVLNKEDTYSE